MKSYLGKILICVVPVAIACVIVGWAFHKYSQGEGGFRLGVDLVGGTILVYQVDASKPGANSEKIEDLAAALKRRIDPNDLYNITIRPIPGDPPRVEVILPTGGMGHGKNSLTHEEIEKIRGLIAQQGRLEFRILANTTDDRVPIADAEKWIKDHPKELERANDNGEPPPPLPKPYTITINGENGEYTNGWVEIGKEELYSLHLNRSAENDPQYSSAWKAVASAREKGEAIATLPNLNGCLLYSRKIPERRRKELPAKDKDKEFEYYVLTREETDQRKVVTGDFLDVGGIKAGTDEKGGLTVDFAFNSEGAIRFADLTTLNRPVSKEAGSFKRHLAIILDGLVRSAPVINTPITGGRGQISGDFTHSQIESLVRILRAGALPATLLPNPVAQNSMGATLGADTIRKGTISVIVAFAAVLLFMAVYYRFAGLVACFALLANLILTVAFMVLVSATFTLPGLAGLVLMLGMAVDANILIYERLREERERGASLALAIRNGYDRAFPTIIDTHLSSIFTAIVLYIVGNDQLKGFGISLTVGLIISLFTSLYITRTIFDIWMGMGWLRELKMMHLFKRPNFDFMSIRYYWFTATIILTILGGAVFIYRLDKGGLNIDFVGGTAYGGRLREPVSLPELRHMLAGCKLPDLSIEQIFVGDTPFSSGEKSKFFNIRTTDKNAKEVQDEINQLLANELDHVKMTWEPLPSDDPQAKELAEDNKRGYLLKFTTPDGKETAYASLYRVRTMLQEEIDQEAKENPEEQKYLSPRNFTVRGDSAPVEERYSQMLVIVNNEVPKTADDEVVKKVLDVVAKTYSSSPQPDRLENFDQQLAASTQQKALLAIVLSWGAILLYLWFRFGTWTFGAAAVMCLIHDLFFTLGVIAGCHFLHEYTPWLANILLLQDFKIDLPAVAALLTLVGYSTNDTIVVFDRIREVRGKNPALTPQMINDSVNQTLSRTVLASLATWLVVVVLYFFGGEGVHLFAFVMVVGVIVGTYSSIYIASPLLLIFGEGVTKRTPVREREPLPTETQV
jgi:SecD/SecF fusion protein